ncbi:MAG: 4Fe-4S cluster-binding domain-containing protein [Ignavibacteriae bacterium]|nr:4Fe-4S cluster-binding domain-containing protein [Ignavibacteriota bacterium]
MNTGNIRFHELMNCSLCPRDCKVNRYSNNLGYCKSYAGFNISSICIHKGEEPVISGMDGICNVFFSSCNLQCNYCQNYQISRNKNNNEFSRKNFNLNYIITEIINCLDNGCHSVGFVSPSHNIPQMKLIIQTIRDEGYNPIFVMNTNAYDRVDTIRTLEDFIDVYLPDFKYSDNSLAKEFSDISNYKEIALDSIKEMYKLVGSNLHLNESGIATSGLIIRHLILPGNIENSINVLRLIADNFSTQVNISLMSQYSPTVNVCNIPFLNRKLSNEEYQIVLEEMERLGFENGWIQDLESSEIYIPDFNLDEPFS